MATDNILRPIDNILISNHIILRPVDKRSRAEYLIQLAQDQILIPLGKIAISPNNIIKSINPIISAIDIIPLPIENNIAGPSQLVVRIGGETEA